MKSFDDLKTFLTQFVQPVEITAIEGNYSQKVFLVNGGYVMAKTSFKTEFKNEE